jgi:hypothetical protein
MNDDLLLRAQDLSRRLTEARTAHRRAEHTLACLLAELAVDELFRPLGYASLEEFARATLDLTARQTRDLARIGRALPRLPRLAATLEAGELDWTKAREVVRIATAETEAAWIERAKGVSCRQLELDVATADRGELPPTEPGRADAIGTLVLRGQSVDLAVIQAGVADYCARLGNSGDTVDATMAIAAIVRRYLADGARDEAAAASAHTPEHDDTQESPAPEPAWETRRAPCEAGYRIVVEHCPSCRSAHLPEAEISDTVVAEALCDAEIVELRSGPKQGHVTRTIPPATRRLVFARAKGRCEIPGCRNRLWLVIHHLQHRGDGGDHHPTDLVCLCTGHHRLHHDGHLGIARATDGRIVVTRADATLVVGPGGWAHVGHERC